MGSELSLVLQLAITVGGLGAAVVFLRSRVVKESQIETDRLLALRQERIEALERKVEVMEQKQTMMQAELTAVHKLQTTKIIEGVVSGVLPHIG